jgi:hypothetical protein
MKHTINSISFVTTGRTRRFLQIVLPLGLLALGTTALAAGVGGVVPPATTKTVYTSEYNGTATGETINLQITCDVAKTIDVGGVTEVKSGIAYVLKPGGGLEQKRAIDVPDQPTNFSFSVRKGSSIVIEAYGDGKKDKKGCVYSQN